MATIIYTPPSNFPDQMRLSLGDGRTIQLEEGVHNYADDVVIRLWGQRNINAAVANMLSSKILVIQLPQQLQQNAVKLQQVDGQNAGMMPMQSPIPQNQRYATNMTNDPNLGMGSPIPQMQGIQGYFPVETTIPGVSGPYGQEQSYNLNQYTDQNGQPIQRQGAETVQVNNPADIFTYNQQQANPGIIPTPTGNVSQVRANGQVEGATSQLVDPIQQQQIINQQQQIINQQQQQLAQQQPLQQVPPPPPQPLTQVPPPPATLQEISPPAPQPLTQVAPPQPLSDANLITGDDDAGDATEAAETPAPVVQRKRKVRTKK